MDCCSDNLSEADTAKVACNCSDSISLRAMDTIGAAREQLDTFALSSGIHLYQIGLFDPGVTIYKQQRRALNLAWSLIHSEDLQSSETESRPSVAVIGAGFAGVTFAAALIRRNVNASIMLFERADTILPLQYGCHTRWVHPRIYDWPKSNSMDANANLPLLNWRADSAAEVVDTVRNGWKRIVEANDKAVAPKPELKVVCNIKHIRVFPAAEKKFRVEWVGDLRLPSDPSLPPLAGAGETGRSGRTDNFTYVVLATGFGVEREHSVSYWRNEMLAQPKLIHARETYIVSGGGDSAMIDLLRLRIAHFRQDRILQDLFGKCPEVTDALKIELDNGGENTIDYDWFHEKLFSSELNSEITDVLKRLRGRLRNDTTVILHRESRFELRDIFKNPGASFHNRLLVFLLLYCGGFIPSDRDIATLRREYRVPENRVICRYGTKRAECIAGIISPEFLELFDVKRGRKAYLAENNPHARSRAQYSVRDYLEELIDAEAIRVSNRIVQQKLDAIDEGKIDEYFNIAGRRGAVPQLIQGMAEFLTRAVRHAVMSFGGDGAKPLVQATFLRCLGKAGLQQCCRFIPIEKDDNSIGNTYPNGRGIMSIAVSTGRIVRTVIGATKKEVQTCLKGLNSPATTESRADDIASAAVFPILGKGRGDGKVVVLGVLTAVSAKEDAFTDAVLRLILPLCEAFTRLIDIMEGESIISNESDDHAPTATGHVASPDEVEVMTDNCMEPPTANVSVLNFSLRRSAAN